MTTSWRNRSQMLRRRNCERGQDLAEFAIVLPVLLLLILGIIEFGVLIYAYNSISNAAREGARYGIVHPTQIGTSPDDCFEPEPNTIRAAACNLTTGLDTAAVEVDTTVTNGSAGTLGQVTVKVTYDAQLLTASIIQAVGGDGTIELGSSATMNREQ